MVKFINPKNLVKILNFDFGKIVVPKKKLSFEKIPDFNENYDSKILILVKLPSRARSHWQITIQKIPDFDRFYELKNSSFGIYELLDINY